MWESRRLETQEEENPAARGTSVLGSYAPRQPCTLPSSLGLMEAGLGTHTLPGPAPSDLLSQDTLWAKTNPGSPKGSSSQTQPPILQPRPLQPCALSAGDKHLSPFISAA